MISNSPLTKWHRLAHKQLDQQFVHEIIHEMDCSSFEASAILDTVYRVYRPYFETSGTLKPGQVLFQVVSVETSANTPLAEGKQVSAPSALACLQIAEYSSFNHKPAASGYSSSACQTGFRPTNPQRLI